MRNFLPSIGRLVRYAPPEGEGVRVDTGVYEGAEISVYYDPMIAKLVGYGATRAEASARLAALNMPALDRWRRGVRPNEPRVSESGTFCAVNLRPSGFAGVRACPAASAPRDITASRSTTPAGTTATFPICRWTRQVNRCAFCRRPRSPRPRRPGFG